MTLSLKEFFFQEIQKYFKLLKLICEIHMNIEVLHEERKKAELER